MLDWSWNSEFPHGSLSGDMHLVILTFCLYSTPLLTMNNPVPGIDMWRCAVFLETKFTIQIFTPSWIDVFCSLFTYVLSSIKKWYFGVNTEGCKRCLLLLLLKESRQRKVVVLDDLCYLVLWILMRRLVRPAKIIINQAKISLLHRVACTDVKISWLSWRF